MRVTSPGPPVSRVGPVLGLFFFSSVVAVVSFLVRFSFFARLTFGGHLQTTRTSPSLIPQQERAAAHEDRLEIIGNPVSPRMGKPFYQRRPFARTERGGERERICARRADPVAHMSAAVLHPIFAGPGYPSISAFLSLSLLPLRGEGAKLQKKEKEKEGKGQTGSARSSSSAFNRRAKPRKGRGRG